MSSAFCLTVRFLDPVPSFHGRADGDEPEWPPSPLRVYQALVAAAAARWRESQFAAYAQPALKWLELRTPILVAPSIQAERNGYRMYVPNNAGDLVTSAWARGNTDAKFSSLNVEKDVRPTRLVGGDCVHYVWPLAEPLTTEVQGHLATLSSAARSITHVGWGIDMVAANATVITDEEVAKLPGERWRRTESGGTALRVPVEGTLAALADKHAAFLTRLGPDGFKPVPPLSALRVVSYRRDRDPVKRPIAAFSILKLDANGFRPFDTVRWGRCVAGMLRHAARVTAQNSGWPNEKIASFVLGHGEIPGEEHKPIGPMRFAYLPLPSIEQRGDTGRVASGIRRALITVLGDGGHPEITWARRQLSGVELVAEQNGKFLAECETNNLSRHDPLALLSLLPESDKGVTPYIKPSTEWTTVTPVALPGSDEGKANKTDKLLDKMFRHAGYSLGMLADLDFRRMPFLRGAEDAMRYRPNGSHHLAHCTMYHLRLRWKFPVPGPIALGSGRFCGLGLFVADPNYER
jgi:CRISPR-associated protein Csb2